MSINTDAIIIPIEVDTKMSKEIDANIKKLEKLNKQNKEVKDKTSSQAVTTLEDQGERRGGIFGGVTEGKAKPKDRKSRQAVIRTSEFGKMKKEISGLQKAEKKIQGSLGDMKEITSMMSGAGGIAKFALRFVPFIGPALIALGFVELVMKELFRDGGFFDRRLNLKISKQFFKLTGRAEAKKLSEGYSTLRVTSRKGLRGPTSQVYNPQQEAKRGTPFLSEDQESLSKNLF